ncbi:MAG: tRNA pseudouridine(38-40) synthase TruA [Lachnospiraceae bacterium]|nr:tRNA pseudouridine(38-40) synthase TruA [Lachnospiraceae bacterium]
MRRILLRVAYDGTNYHGWQIQNNGITIEAVLNAALSELLGEEIAVTGGSRTDAGVHAMDNVAVFDTRARIPAEKIPYALNRRLPADVRILHGEEVAADFHPRHCGSIKTYEYKILHAPFQIPQYRLYHYWTYVPLNTAMMRAAAAPLLGEHDFTSFCSLYAQAEDHVRTIYELQVEEHALFGMPGADTQAAPGQAREIVIRVSGSGFLYNMVRIIAGTLMEAGRGRLDAAAVARILAAKERHQAGPTAPPQGLVLKEYRFL